MSPYFDFCRFRVVFVFRLDLIRFKVFVFAFALVSEISFDYKFLSNLLFDPATGRIDCGRPGLVRLRFWTPVVSAPEARLVLSSLGLSRVLDNLIQRIIYVTSIGAG